jgi:hypothetical protein
LTETECSASSRRNYNGYINMWSGGVDLFSANVLMLGFESAGRERLFPATAMRYSTAKAVAEELRSHAATERSEFARSGGDATALSQGQRLSRSLRGTIESG